MASKLPVGHLLLQEAMGQPLLHQQPQEELRPFK